MLGPGFPELFNILINPISHAFALRWHRDDVKEKATADEEIEALAQWHHGVRPLFPVLVPVCIYRVSKQRADSMEYVCSWFL